MSVRNRLGTRFQWLGLPQGTCLTVNLFCYGWDMLQSTVDFYCQRQKRLLLKIVNSVFTKWKITDNKLYNIMTNLLTIWKQLTVKFSGRKYIIGVILFPCITATKQCTTKAIKLFPSLKRII